MASTTITSRQSPVSFSPSASLLAAHSDEPLSLDGSMDSEFLPGAKLSERQSFRNVRGSEMSLTPLIVDFRRLLQARGGIPVMPGVTNRDLLHSVIALYNTSLSEMTPDVLYATVCEKWARTILLVRDQTDTLMDLELRKNTVKPPKKKEKDPVVNGIVSEPAKKKEEENHIGEEKDIDEENEAEEKPDEDVLEPEEPRPGKFDGVFSDTSSEESDDDDDDDEDFSKGVNAFIEAVKARRESRNAQKGALSEDHVGIENRIMGAATFKKAYCKSERVMHLTLLAVRKRYRRWGIGRFLLSVRLSSQTCVGDNLSAAVLPIKSAFAVKQVKDTNIVGNYDAVVVHADNGAVEFFERYGFTSDIVLNSKWSDLAEQFTNCTLMCYLPPFTGQTMLSNSIPELDIIAMEKEIKKWREKSIEAYKAEMACMNRLRHEIVHLRALTSSQHELITALTTENHSLSREKFIVEREYLQYRQLATKNPECNDNDLQDDEDDDISAEVLIQQLREHARISSSNIEEAARNRLLSDSSGHFLLSRGAAPNEPYCHGQDTQAFYQITRDFHDALKKDPSVLNSHTIKSVMKATLDSSVEEAITARIKELGHSNMTMRLYYCGSLEQPHRNTDILREGFDLPDFSGGDYGRGLHFTQYPSKAALFSTVGKLIVADVNLGKTETVVRRDSTRGAASKGYHSIVTPGRLTSTGETDMENILCQEYIIFDRYQARPLYEIEYCVTV